MCDEPGLAAAQTLKPSFLKHTLCASIIALQASSPSRTTHSSRSLRVSGHAQQILHVGFFSSVVDCSTLGGDDESPSMTSGGVRVPGLFSYHHDARVVARGHTHQAERTARTPAVLRRANRGSMAALWKPQLS